MRDVQKRVHRLEMRSLWVELVGLGGSLFVALWLARLPRTARVVGLIPASALCVYIACMFSVSIGYRLFGNTAFRC